MTDYQKRELERQKKREATLRAIAGHLDGWEFLEERNHEAVHLYLVGPEGVRVHAGKDWNDNGRFAFSPDLSDGLSGFETYQHPDRPEAGISVDRDPRAAARDVKRRCLDPAVPYVLKLRAEKARIEARDEARWDALATLAAALGGEIVKGYHGNPTPLEARAHRRDGYGSPSAEAKLTTGELVNLETHAYGPDRVNVKLDYLPMDVALDLCAWLRLRLWPANGEQGRLF